MKDTMKEVSIHFPDKHIEKMFVRNLKCTNDITKALKERKTLNTDNPQLDIEDYFNEGYVSFYDAITGEHIVSVMW